MKKTMSRLLAGLALGLATLGQAAELPTLDAYNVVWDSPSKT